MDQQRFYGRQIWIPFYSRFWRYYLVHPPPPPPPPNVQCVVIHRCHHVWSLFLEWSLENPNYYGIAVIFNYHSSGSSMYKYLTFITCSMIYQHRYSYAYMYVNENILSLSFSRVNSYHINFQLLITVVKKNRNHHTNHFSQHKQNLN